ncbi:hypothetical protein [Peribacillus asahii]|uniref:hypothetical protein n=1 Tax=Peribacillus asahii TaxID=228899 RepID=UPI00382CD5BE
MKKFITAVAMSLGILTAGVITQAPQVEASAPAKYLQDTTTETFVVLSVTADGYLDCKPVNPNVEGGYILDNDGKYKLGDIVEITYWNDDIIESHKLTGKALSSVENKYGSYINSLMDESIAEDAYERTVYNKQIKNLEKVSANTTKVNHTVKEKNVTIALKNHNKYEVGVELQAQKLVNGKWKNLDWYDFGFLTSGEKVYAKHSIKNDFNSKKGTYRYKVTTINYDLMGNEFKEKVSYTGKVILK